MHAKKGPPRPLVNLNADESERIIITPVITDDIFASFLRCPTKSYLDSSKCSAVLNETIDWHAQLELSYRERTRARLASKSEVPELFWHQIGDCELANDKVDL